MANVILAVTSFFVGQKNLWTFDVSILSNLASIKPVVATSDVSALGGQDFTRNSAVHLNDIFLHKYGLDVSKNHVQLRWFMRAAECANMAMSETLREYLDNVDFMILRKPNIGAKIDRNFFMQVRRKFFLV